MSRQCVCGELVGIERAGTVRKLCLVHSIIASSHGRGRENKEGLAWFWDFLVTGKLFTWAEICESKREREKVSLVFLFMSIITLYFFLVSSVTFFPWGKSCVTGQCNRQLFGSSFSNCQFANNPSFLIPLASLSLSSLLCSVDGGRWQNLWGSCSTTTMDNFSFLCGKE